MNEFDNFWFGREYAYDVLVAIDEVSVSGAVEPSGGSNPLPIKTDISKANTPHAWTAHVDLNVPVKF